MKTYILSLVLALAAFLSRSAQTEPPQLKQAPSAARDIFDQIQREAQQKWSVEKCRAYAEMQWVLRKEGENLDALSVPELVTRADQIATCFGEIDTQPLEKGVTCSEALDIIQKRDNYLAVVARFRGEALGRITQ